MAANELVECEVWLLVDENGEWEVAKDAADLQAEAGLANRMVKVTVRVPQPRAVELEAEIAKEPAGAGLRAV